MAAVSPRAAALALAGAGALLVVGCGPGEHERCRDAADADAQRRLERECPVLFAPCPTVHEIYLSWRIAQDTCPP